MPILRLSRPHNHIVDEMIVVESGMPPPSFLVFRKLQDSVGNQETHDKEIAVDDYLCWTCQHHTYRLDYTTLMYRKLHLHLNRPGE